MSELFKIDGTQILQFSAHDVNHLNSLYVIHNSISAYWLDGSWPPAVRDSCCRSRMSHETMPGDQCGSNPYIFYVYGKCFWIMFRVICQNFQFSFATWWSKLNTYLLTNANIYLMMSHWLIVRHWCAANGAHFSFAGIVCSSLFCIFLSRAVTAACILSILHV